MCIAENISLCLLYIGSIWAMNMLVIGISDRGSHKLDSQNLSLKRSYTTVLISDHKLTDIARPTGTFVRDTEVELWF